MVALVCIFGAFEIIMYVLMMSNVIPEETISLQLFVINIAFPVISIGTMIYLYIKYSGIPILSQDFRAKLNKINSTMLFWCVFRIIADLLYIFLADPVTSAEIF